MRGFSNLRSQSYSIQSMPYRLTAPGRSECPVWYGVVWCGVADLCVASVYVCGVIASDGAITHKSLDVLWATISTMDRVGLDIIFCCFVRPSCLVRKQQLQKGAKQRRGAFWNVVAGGGRGSVWVLYGYGHGRLGCFPLPVPMGRLGRLTHRSVQQSVGGPRVLT